MEKLKALSTVFAKLLYLVVFFLINTNATAQSWCSTLDTSQVSVTRPAQPTNCWNLLNEFKTDKDRDYTLQVRLKVWVFCPTNTVTGYWTKPGHATTFSDAVDLAHSASELLANLASPQIPTGGVPTGTNNARISFTVAGIQYVVDDSVYNHLDALAQNHSFPYKDSTCLNIYLPNLDGFNAPHSGNSFSLTNAHPYPATYPLNYMVLYPRLDTSAFDHHNPDWDNIGDWGGTRWAQIMTHEAGHILGLTHSTGIINSLNPGEPYAYIEPVFGCCNYVEADDYIRETFVSFDTCGTPGGSNNIMSQNSACMKYLSPKQIAVMNYNLATTMKSVLSPASYTALAFNPAYNDTITADETWDVDHYCKGNVIINSGVTLSITCSVAMTDSSSMIVEPGGRLVIDGGTITNISGFRWGGIEVGGYKTKNQHMESSGYATYQGVVKIINGGTLSHSYNAIKNYKKNPSTGDVDWNTTGGIIIADHANFINNTRDVEFLSYHGGPSISNFNSCQFKTNGWIGKHINGTDAVPLMHASLWDIEGVRFMNCNFSFSADTIYGYHGIGIASSDATYLVDKTGTLTSTFSGLNTGIKAENSNPLKLPSISNTDFISNNEDAVYLKNMNSLLFENNSIDKTYNGLYLFNCKNYNVKNNSFVNNVMGGTGIYSYFSQEGGHNIYRNIFNNLDAGIIPVGNNGGITGLKMNCNDFSATPNNYDIAMMHGPAILIGSSMVISPIMQAKVNKTQGASNQVYNLPTDAVRNIYGATSSCSVCENEWFIEGISTQTISHPSNTQSYTQPLPHPDKSDTVVKVINIGQPLTYSTDCVPYPSSSGGSGSTPGQRMANTYTYLSNLKTLNSKGDYNFEIQATAATQLNYFLSDTASASKDSVISLLENNRGNFPDADILTVYAYMHKGDYSGAATKISALSDRTAWAVLLTKQLDFAIYPEHLYNLSDTSSAFLAAYAAYDSLDGSSTAQSLLNQFGGGTYGEPRPLPSAGSAARLSHLKNNTDAPQTIKQIGLSNEITVYPNPASDAIQVFYRHEAEHTLKIIMTDALGRPVYDAQAQSNSVLSIPLTNVLNGVYLLNAFDGKVHVYRSKVIVMK